MAQAMRAQLAQMLGFGGADPVAMTDELRAELMRDLEALDDAQGGGGGAPGGFPGDEDEEDYNDDEGDEEEEEVAVEGGAGGLLARFGAMLGGRAA